MVEYPLIFLRQLKELIGADNSYTGIDARCTQAINSASRTIENLLGRVLAKNTYTEYLSSKNNLLKGYDLYGVGETGIYFQYKPINIYLKSFPIDPDADFSVYYDPNQAFTEDTKLTTDDYDLDLDRGEYKRALKVIYTAGYSSTVDTDNDVVYDANAAPPQEQALANNLPADLVQAAIWQAMFVYDKQYSGNVGVRYSRGEGSTKTTQYVSYGGLAPEAAAIIAQHKRRKFDFF
jgi:hypothetical protein